MIATFAGDTAILAVDHTIDSSTSKLESAVEKKFFIGQTDGVSN